MKYKRVLLKFSGEALKEPGGSKNFDRPRMEYIAREIQKVLKAFPDIELSLMPGGGNHGRGSELIQNQGFHRRNSHQIGMLYTIVNSLAMSDVLASVLGSIPEVRVMSAMRVDAAAEPYLPKRAIHHMKHGRLVVFAGGSGLTCFSTDSAAVNRAAELELDAVLKGTKERGVFDSDPRKNPDARFLSHVTNKEFVKMDLKQIFDPPAVTDAGESRIPIHIFNVFEEDNLLKLLSGEVVGTHIFPEIEG
ncbi:MAG: UMP kinase [bacterium]|nr:UMP kinase [bacterium]